MSVKKKDSSEIWYFQILQRHLDNVTFEFYTKQTEFRRLAKKNKNEDECFVAVLDVDIDYKNLEVSKKARMDIIELFAKSPNVEVYLSSRCWENWLIGHFVDFNQYTTNDTHIPIPDYKKQRKWYTANQDLLMATLNMAIQRCVKQRRVGYDHNCIPADCDEIPDLKIRSLSLKIIELCNPISYIDILIKKIYKMNGTSLESVSTDKVPN
ncbi:RloB domain-containing protein [Bacillus paranthracis]